MDNFFEWLEHTTFEQKCDKINGKPYTDGVPSPCHYNFGSYTDLVTNGTPIANVCNGQDAKLTPLTWEDQARYSFDDVVDAYGKIHKGKNPFRLGDPLDDEGFKKYQGL